MVVSFIPGPNGMVRNFHIIGNGSIFDENEQVITQGFFNGGVLDGPTVGYVTKYSTDSINIRSGTYARGLEDGQIYEYVFPKTDWLTFKAGIQGVSVTKYTHMFSNGVWKSTSATEIKQAKGKFAYNAKGNMIAFSFTSI